MKVIATKPGFDGLHARQPGETFDMPAGTAGSWFLPCDENGKALEVDEATGQPLSNQPAHDTV